MMRKETGGLMNACRMFATKLILNNGDFMLGGVCGGRLILHGKQTRVGKNEEDAWIV